MRSLRNSDPTRPQTPSSRKSRIQTVNQRFTPEYASGAVNYDWLDKRQAGHAEQDGRYCFVTHSTSVALLRDEFPLERYGVRERDFDASLLKDAAPRALTRSIARWLYLQRDDVHGDLVDGIEFRSRHGDELRMWAIFERADDGPVSSRLQSRVSAPLTSETEDLQRAFALHHLSWA
ncbi:MAG: hypothetical protein ACYCZY_11005 [Lacisediminihabitans sp.]